ncbi:hypothetical protein, partial [Paenibacillus sp. JCM 10914]|uniref:hypothetical protein n=1 Tax=Paenibacillus sp. JCM 10914 TaxID=1236974 RepID=UPI00056C26BE
SYYQVNQLFLVGLFLWAFYDGGSRENEALLGAFDPVIKTVLPLSPMTMFELVEALTSHHKRSYGFGTIVGMPATDFCKGVCYGSSGWN